MLTPTRRIGASKLATVTESQMPDGSLVAVKRFDRLNLSAFKHDRFFGAAKIWQSLANPLLVRYIDVKPETNEVIQELWDRSAAVRLSEGNSDPKLVFHVLRDILKALAVLHDLGYLHANIKPSNVFFNPRGYAMLSDGLLVDVHSPGTLPPPINQKYLTPEHTNDEYGSMTPSTDLYSAGFLALELLAGDRFGRAFQGVGDDAADDDLAWFQWHGSSLVAPDANSFAKACPAELTRVIRKLVAKNPNERYRSAQQALSDLPDDLIVAPPPSSPVAGTKLKRELLASDILQRPTNGVVLVIASGSRAGEMIGTDLSQFSIGFSDDCLICFQSDKQSDGQARVVFSRSPDGWSIRSEYEGRVYVNEHFLSEERPLRSGDIIRLSANGPDLQFTLQSGGFDIRQLVDRFLPGRPAQNTASNPSQYSGRINQESSSPSSLPKGATLAPRGPIDTSVSQRPLASNPTNLAPQPPSAPHSRSAPSPRNPSTPSGNPLPPGKSNPQSPSNGRTPLKTQPTNSVLEARLFQPKSWSKQQKNWAILLGGLCLISLILFLPSSESAPNAIKKEPKERKTLQESSAESEVTAPPAPNAQVDPGPPTPMKTDAQSPAPKKSSEENPFAGLDDID